jgi:hypothetical protein
MIKYRIIAKAKKYKMLDGYTANASSSTSFLTHITKKFQNKNVDFMDRVYYTQKFTTLELLKASAKGHIVIEFICVQKPL